MGFISNCPAFDKYSGLCLGSIKENTIECKNVVMEQYCDCLFDAYCSEYKGVVVTNPKGKDYVNNEKNKFDRLYELVDNWFQESDFCAEQMAFAAQPEEKAVWEGKRFCWYQAAKYLKATLEEMENEGRYFI